MKNFFLMALVNIGIVLTLSLVLQVTGLNQLLYANGFNYVGLAGFCLFWGMGGALMSLFLSKTMVKFSMGVKVVPYGEGSPEVLRLQQILQRICAKANLKKLPEFGIYESSEMNAFATGPSESHALVAISTGLMTNMSEDEIEGVLAHEVAHIKNGDMVTMTLLQGIVNALVMFIARIISFAVANNLEKEGQRYWVRFMVMMVCQTVLGFLGVAVTAWFSRHREFRADKGGAQYASPQKMMAALMALQRRFEASDNRAPQLAAFKISSGGKDGFSALLSTHPPLNDRIQALKSISVSGNIMSVNG